jgi:hypothetical protein
MYLSRHYYRDCPRGHVYRRTSLDSFQRILDLEDVSVGTEDCPQVSCELARHPQTEGYLRARDRSPKPWRAMCRVGSELGRGTRTVGESEIAEIYGRRGGLYSTVGAARASASSLPPRTPSTGSCHPCRVRSWSMNLWPRPRNIPPLFSLICNCELWLPLHASPLRYDVQRFRCDPPRA